MQVIDLIQGRKWKCAQCKNAGLEGSFDCSMVNYKIPGAILEIGFIHHGTEIRINFPNSRLNSSELAYEYARWLDQIEIFSGKPWVPFRSGAIEMPLENPTQSFDDTIMERAQVTWSKDMLFSLEKLIPDKKPKAQLDPDGFRKFIDGKRSASWTPKDPNFNFTWDPPAFMPDPALAESVQRGIAEELRRQVMRGSMNPDVGLSYNRSRFEGIRKPRCMVCNREVERMQIFEDLPSDRLRVALDCHGRRDDFTVFTGAGDSYYISSVISQLPAFRADYDRLNGQPAAAPALPAPKRPQINLAKPPPRRIILE